VAGGEGLLLRGASGGIPAAGPGLTPGTP